MGLVERFVEVCKRRILHVNVDQRYVMVLDGEEGLICKNFVNQFKYLQCVEDERGTDVAECLRKVEGIIRSLVNDINLQPEFVSVFHEAILILVVLYGSETVAWREKENLGLQLCR